jgi:hypothetical protein
MEEVVDRQFSNQRVEIGGCVYRRCSFEDCVLAFTRGAEPCFDSCSFDRCTWEGMNPAIAALLTGLSGGPSQNSTE